MAGPGTELMGLLMKFRLHPTEACKCKERAHLMNAWGVEECYRRKGEIVSWMREEAQKRRWPFSAAVAGQIVSYALRKAKRKQRKKEQRKREVRYSNHDDPGTL